MTPQEKAKELYGKYWKIMDTLSVKQSALIAVDEIISMIKIDYMKVQNRMQTIEYWQEVKQEIEKL